MPVFNSDQRVASVAAVGRFRSTSYYSRGTNEPAGSATMTRYIAMFPIKGRVPATTANRLFGNRSGPDGYLMQWTVGGAFAQEFLFRIHDGGAVARTVEMPMFLAPLNRLVIGAFSYDGAFIRGRTNEGFSIGVAAGGGYTAGVVNTFVGIDALLTVPTLEWSIAALLGSDVEARSDAQMATDITTLLENLQNGRDLRTSLGHTPSFYWDAADVATAGGVTGLTWTDRVGSLTLTRTGTPEGYGHAARVL